MTVKELIAALEENPTKGIKQVASGQIDSWGDLAEMVAAERVNNPNYDKEIHPKLLRALNYNNYHDS